MVKNEVLVKALEHSFDMDYDDARGLAKVVRSAFKRKSEVEDMSLDKHVRSIFYELHKKHLLMLRREELREKGKIIRKYFWSFDLEKIKKCASAPPMSKEDPYGVYGNIPREAWILRSKYT